LIVRLRRFYDANHLHYVTTSTYRRTRVFDSDRFKRKACPERSEWVYHLPRRLARRTGLSHHRLRSDARALPFAFVALGISQPFLDHAAARRTRCQVRPEEPAPVPGGPLVSENAGPAATSAHRAPPRPPSAVATALFTTSTSGVRGRSGRSWTTCTTTPSNAVWWRSPETGRGRAGVFTICRTARFSPWTGYRSRKDGKKYAIRFDGRDASLLWTPMT